MDGCNGNVIEDEPKCDADEQREHKYSEKRRWKDLGMLYVKVQCHECRMVCETRYGLDERLQCRRFYDPGRWLLVNE